MKRWTPRQQLTEQEKKLINRLSRVKKLFAFLRLHRAVIFDEPFQEELEASYRKNGSGIPALPPALLCMAVLLQSYVGASDAEAVELSVVDLRWQMVLDCLGADKPAYSQGSLFNFRKRLIAENMDVRLLERTVEVARKTKKFDYKKLPDTLRVAVDSRPLVGAGRVEDTINLIGRAAKKVARTAAKIFGIGFEKICEESKAPVFLAPSIKSGLDLNWNDAGQKANGLQVLNGQINQLLRWVRKNISSDCDASGELARDILLLNKIQEQDLKHNPDGTVTVKEGVAPERIVSVNDPEMRHGRKSKSKKFNGYKEHVAADLDSQLILAVAVTPANRPEEEAAGPLLAHLSQHSRSIGAVHIDRGYVNSDLVDAAVDAGGDVLCKPWSGKNVDPELYGKRDFKVDMRSCTITCPAGQEEKFTPGDVVFFDPEACGPCPLRSKCTRSASGKGRTISTRADERLQHRLRKLQDSPAGRQTLRERVSIEHRLAHISARKGPRARYIGVRKNEFDLRRATTIQNLETIQRKIAS